MPKIDQPIEDSTWNTIDDQLIYFTLTNAPFLSESFKPSPLSTYDDGYNDLVLQKGPNVGRLDIAKFIIYFHFHYKDS